MKIILIMYVSFPPPQMLQCFQSGKYSLGNFSVGIIHMMESMTGSLVPYKEQHAQ